MDTVPTQWLGDFLADFRGAGISPSMCILGIPVLNQFLKPLKTALRLCLDFFFIIVLVFSWGNQNWAQFYNAWSSWCPIEGKCHLSVWHIKWSLCIVSSSIPKEFDTKDVPRDCPPNGTFQDLSTQLSVKLKILRRHTPILSILHFTEPRCILHTPARNWGQITEFIFFQPSAFLIMLWWLVSSWEEIQKASYSVSFQ